uniref:Bm4526 n=1 Tax=Brugia malayi TaxID=6279 RepID=A0A0H5S4G2_BRUMA|nr:Bm4526 [Brugia malayi]
MHFSNDSILSANKSPSSWMPPTQSAHIFGAIFIGCGVAALIFNAAIMITLCHLRRNILSRVFYLLIFNFAIIDLLKSTCSIIWALKMLPAGISTSMYFMKADQFALMILRFANLATILNLLILTLNEYVYIIYPFHYRRLVTNTRVTLLIVTCWIIAWGLTLSILFFGSRKQSIYVKPDCLMKRKHFSQHVNNEAITTTITTIAITTTITTTTKATTTAVTDNISYSLRLPSSCFIRNSQISNNTEFVYNIVVIVFCFVCLVISVACYGGLIRVISKIVKNDTSIAIDNDCQANDSLNGEFNRTRKRLLKRNKYVIVIGSVLAIYTVYLISYSAIKFLFVSRLKSSRLGISFTAMYYVRWGFQTLMCINTLLQPLCYFRMQEFRSTFKTVIFRRKQSKSLIAETTYLSTTESRRRIVFGNNNRNDKNEREQIT